MEKVYIIQGNKIVLHNSDAYERCLKELSKPETFHTRIFNADQVVVEKIKNPTSKVGQHYFAIKTCNGIKPPKHQH